ncbi:MAG: class I SAM-dependent methyltransferase [Dehalococcoidia bacterium]|nr:class I SAM-dependent methyltransferase [Dehalococcoidia bacterium]
MRPDNHFDRVAKEYNSSLPSHVVAHYLKKRVALVQSVIPLPGPILDVGAGTGLLAWKLAGLGYHVTGLDASLGMLHEVPVDGPAERLLGSATHLPFRDGAFPGVITVATLHHIADPLMVAASLREMVRVTAPGGATMIWDHNPRNPYWPILMRRMPQDEEDTRLIPLEEILAVLDHKNGHTVGFSRHGWTPDFAPAWALPAFKALEALLERLPVISTISAHNVVVVRKGR